MADNSVTNKETMSGPLQCYALRLTPGKEIQASLQEVVKVNQLTSAFVLTCVGSVTKARLRMANAQEIKLFEGCREIVSLVGTISGGATGHLHISLSDDNGDVIGGHVVGDLIVHTTAEIMIGQIAGVNFSRQFDKKTGYDELVLEKLGQ